MIVSNDLIIKSFDTGFQLSVWLSKGLIINPKISTIKSIDTQIKVDSKPCNNIAFLGCFLPKLFLHTQTTLSLMLMFIIKWYNES